MHTIFLQVANKCYGHPVLALPHSIVITYISALNGECQWGRSCLANRWQDNLRAAQYDKSKIHNYAFPPPTGFSTCFILPVWPTGLPARISNRLPILYVCV